jgi:glycosyltransferase involved in cell wall biosynthesis
MKITIVLGAFFPVPPIMGGAVEKVWFALGQEFARRGHQVLLVSRRHPSLASAECVDGVEYVRVPGFDQPRSLVLLKIQDLVYSLRVRRVLPAADILVTNTFWLPIVERTDRHGLVYVDVQRGPKGQMRWYSRAVRLLAVSRAIADAIVLQTPALKAKVRVIPNPVPFPIRDLPEIPRFKTILFVGRLHPEKGIELLLRSIRRLRRETFGDWTLKIIGPHETSLGGGGAGFLRRMKEFVSPDGIRVEWVGAVFDEAELQRQYRLSTIFVYPSVAENGEALPVAPLEAMANGCVPLVSDLPVFRDYIENEVTGFTFDHRGPCAETHLADSLSRILRLNDEQLAGIRESAWMKASNFAPGSTAQRYLDDFAELLVQN